jgi:hypothetical protein
VTKTINNDFNISWGQNEKDQIKQSAGKGKPVPVLDYNQNTGETDLKDKSFIHKLWKEKKDKIGNQNVHETAECHNSKLRN